MTFLIHRLFYALIFTILPITIYSQVVDLGAASSFALFSSAGAFNNVGATVITGDIGTNVGAFTGFPPGIVIGQVHVADAVSAMAAADLLVAYGALGAITCGQVIGTTMGNDQILTPDVYCTGAASTINGDLYLDAEGDPNAVFIIQIDGALSTTTMANVILINGASACNVYWYVTGAFALGDDANFVGTLLGGGAISLATGSTLNGRALTTAGAISTSANVVNISSCPPEITCPSNLTVSCANLVPAPNPGAIVVTVACPGAFSVTFVNDVVSNQTCDNRYTITRTYLVTDDCGLTASCTQTIGVNDQDPPSTVTCPATLAISCENPVPAPNPSSVGATDACGGAVTTVFVNDEISTSNCPNTYTITRTYQATDDCGNAATCSQTIDVTDNTAPVITCPTVTASVECPAVPDFPAATATDACDPAPVVIFMDVTTPGTCPQEYSVTRTWTAIDACGNASMCSRTINVTDNTAPVIVCPMVGGTIDCSSLPFFPTATASDACDANPMVSFTDLTVPGTCPQEYTLTRTWVAVDDCGNAASCSRTIDVTDNTVPVITCPTVTATVECPALPIFPAATATDVCDPNPMVSFLDVTTPGTCPQEYSVTRTWTAIDACGNAALCSRTINVTDNTAPVITCPTVVVTVECPAMPVFPMATATDICDPSPTVNFLDLTTPGNCPQEYSVTRTWTAVDDCGNVASCSRTINVTDNTAPVITCPTVTASIDCSALPAFPTATALDVCDPSPVVSFTDLTVPGTCPQEYTLTRTWIAIDACGNSTSCSRTIEVTDNTAPIIVCPTVSVNVECPALPVFPPAMANDICDPNPVVNFQDVNTPGTCPQEYIVTRTWTATDACGNSASCSRTINVTDNTAPVITCPTVAVSVECPAQPIFTAATANDVCDPNPMVSSVDVTTPGLCPQEYSVTRTWTATDACGNSASCSRTINVTDNTAPIIVCPTVTASVECPALPVFPPAMATDICDATPVINFLDVTTPGLCPQEYSVTRTWTAVDDCGNSASCSRTINVTDNTAPIIVCPTVTASVECPALPVFPPAMATDICDPNPVVNFLDLTIPGLCPQEYSVTRTWTAVDDCGNSSSCSRTINVTDNTAPLLVCPTVSVNIECPALPVFPPAMATDICDATPVINFLDVTTPGLCPQEYSVTRTWTAVDDCGNSASCSRTINVTDNTAPMLVCPTVSVNVECPALPVFPSAMATDICDATPVINFLDVTTPGICPQEYSVTRTWTAVDDCGNSASCSRTINVTDNTPPMVTCPANLTVACVTQIPLPGGVNAVDLCGGIVSVVHVGDVNSAVICANRLTVTRTYRATDACANSTTCAQIITVFDNIPPAFVAVPPNLTVDCFGLPAVVTPQAMDNCGGVVSVVYLGETELPGVCPTLYTLTRTWRATDVCGNSSMVSQVITVTDTNAPQFTIQPADVLVECVNQDFQSWLDNQGGSVVYDCSEVTWMVENSPVNFDTSGCGNTFIRFIRFIAIDECGNSSYSDARYTVYDATPPNFDVLPENISIECVEGENSDEALEQWLENFGNAEVSDLCGNVALEIKFISNVNGCGNTFTRTYEFRATDECGNTNFVRATFSIVDTTPPVIVECPEGDYLLTCEFDVPLPDLSGVVATDNCGSVYISVMTSTIGVGCVYWPMNVSYWYMATDECGNMVSDCDVPFLVIDSIPPTYTGPDTLEVICVDDLPGPGELTDLLAPYFFDNCYDIICVSDSTPITGPTWITFVIRAKDLCGNWTEKFTVTFIATGNCKPLCTASQTVWGDENGSINGISTSQVIQSYLDVKGSVTVGDFNRTISVSNVECVQSLLPGTVHTYQFGLGNHVFDSTTNCQQPAKMLGDNGTLRNKLAANLIALEMNVWYNKQFNQRDLGVQDLASLPYCIIDPMVMAMMETDLATVQGLINVSNNYLAGLGAFPTGFGALTNQAVANVNTHWQNCQVSNPCPVQVRNQASTANNLYDLSLSPNPVVDEVTLVFEAAAETDLVVRFVGSSGMQSEQAVRVTKGYNTLQFSTKSLPAGVYTVVLQSELGQQSLRMVKMMN